MFCTIAKRYIPIYHCLSCTQQSASITVSLSFPIVFYLPVIEFTFLSVHVSCLLFDILKIFVDTTVHVDSGAELQRQVLQITPCKKLLLLGSTAL